MLCTVTSPSLGSDGFQKHACLDSTQSDLLLLPEPVETHLGYQQPEAGLVTINKVFSSADKVITS